MYCFFFFFQAEDGIRDLTVTGVQTCALPIFLIFAIILHEFSHGILARVAKIKIRSLGLIFLIFPIGAFVEPEEDELRALPRHERARLYAAGPATNMLLAVLFAVVFSSVMLAAVTPVHDGVGIVGFTQGASPAQTPGVQS